MRGEIGGQENVLVRMHARCVAGDVFGSTECDCQRDSASLAPNESPRKARACWCTSMKPAWARAKHSPGGAQRPIHESGIGAQILADLGLTTIRLLTNHPRKVFGLDAFGIEIAGSVPLQELTGINCGARKSTFAGRSASRRIKYGYHAVP